MSKIYDDSNIFARILRGEIPCTKIFENDQAIAFRDIHPQAPVHVLVIPKGAYVDADDFGSRGSDAELAGFARAIAAVVEQENLKDTGYRLIANSGVNSGQEVPHFHTHILAGEKLGPMRARA